MARHLATRRAERCKAERRPSSNGRMEAQGRPLPRWGVLTPIKLELHQLPTWQDQSVAHWPRHPWAKHLEQLGKQERGPPQTRLLTVRICPIKTMLQVASNTQAGRALPQAYDSSSPPQGYRRAPPLPGQASNPFTDNLRGHELRWSSLT